jgi:hypothetical protein
MVELKRIKSPWTTSVREVLHLEASEQSEKELEQRLWDLLK